MRQILMFVTVGLLISCSDDAPTESAEAPPNEGVTQSFRTNPGNNYNCCQDLVPATFAEATKFCISVGYEKPLLGWDSFLNCGGCGGRAGRFISRVTCWKPN